MFNPFSKVPKLPKFCSLCGRELKSEVSAVIVGYDTQTGVPVKQVTESLHCEDKAHLNLHTRSFTQKEG